MENFPKKRGRPRKIPKPTAMLAWPDVPNPEPLLELMGAKLVGARTHANAFYADSAREVVEGLSKQVQMPHDPVLAANLRLGMDWILGRRTVLTELGRMMDGEVEPTEQDVERLQATVRHIAARHDKLTAKAACAYVRGGRLGETKRRDRIASLHHDLNAVINLHHQRFPESTLTDIGRALELSAGQIKRKQG
jgi:hypothetical protein